MKENDPIAADTLGGNSGGSTLILRRSELAIIRRYANRYNFVPGERQEAVDAVMTVIRNQELSPRHKIAAVQTMAMLDKISLAEVSLLLQAKKLKLEELKPVAQFQQNTQINVYLNDPAQLDKLTDDELARCHKETLAVSGESAEPGGADS